MDPLQLALTNLGPDEADVEAADAPASSEAGPVGVTEAAVPPHTRKMAMAAVVLEEWLQELAALAQEHSVLLQQERILADTEAGP